MSTLPLSFRCADDAMGNHAAADLQGFRRGSSDSPVPMFCNRSNTVSPAERLVIPPDKSNNSLALVMPT